MMIPAIVLAAGRSARMGRSKALLPAGADGPSFLARAVAALNEGGACDVLVVCRSDDDELKRAAAELDVPVRVVENPHADEGGQLSSVVAGLNVADRPGIAAVMILPVDVPLVTAETVRALIAESNRTRAPVVRAVHRARHGHPVIFSRAVFDDLRHADPSIGAKAVLQAHAPAVVNVEVADAGTVEDVDTPGDYRRLFGRELP